LFFSMTLFLCVSCSGHHRDLPSFPTRRSSDLSLHVLALGGVRELHADAGGAVALGTGRGHPDDLAGGRQALARLGQGEQDEDLRSEEHTSELQSRENLVCRLLLEKKKEITIRE